MSDIDFPEAPQLMTAEDWIQRTDRSRTFGRGMVERSPELQAIDTALRTYHTTLANYDRAVRHYDGLPPEQQNTSQERGVVVGHLQTLVDHLGAVSQAVTAWGPQQHQSRDRRGAVSELTRTLNSDYATLDDQLLRQEIEQRRLERQQAQEQQRTREQAQRQKEFEEQERQQRNNLSDAERAVIAGHRADALAALESGKPRNPGKNRAAPEAALEPGTSRGPGKTDEERQWFDSVDLGAKEKQSGPGKRATVQAEWFDTPRQSRAEEQSGPGKRDTVQAEWFDTPRQSQASELSTPGASLGHANTGESSSSQRPQQRHIPSDVPSEEVSRPESYVGERVGIRPTVDVRARADVPHSITSPISPPDASVTLSAIFTDAPPSPISADHSRDSGPSRRDPTRRRSDSEPRKSRSSSREKGKGGHGM